MQFSSERMFIGECFVLQEIENNVIKDLFNVIKDVENDVVTFESRPCMYQFAIILVSFDG